MINLRHFQQLTNGYKSVRIVSGVIGIIQQNPNRLLFGFVKPAIHHNLLQLYKI